MKTKLPLAALALALATLNSQLSTAHAQGALTPPGAPAPTMKSLAQVEPRTPISSVPFTITNSGSYYLTTNVTGTAGNGIIINASEVALDLAGFTIAGLGGANGILCGTVTNVTVHNGTLRGWGNIGIYANTGSKNLMFHHLNVSASNQGISVYGATIADCSVVNCGAGIFAYSSSVRDCNVDYSGVTGIQLQPGNATGCLVQHSGNSGIYINLPGCQVIGNTLIGNNAANNPSYAGIKINDANNRIENNHITDSGVAGIAGGSGYSGNLIIKNSVYGNGANNYNIGGTPVVGPIITATGTITNVNPWANFSF